MSENLGPFDFAQDRPGTLDVEPGTWPAVTALCPTYGRFERLRDAVACFLKQDYAGEVGLLILNDAPVPIALRTTKTEDDEFEDDGGRVRIRVVNAPSRYPTLGHKRQALLEMAETELVTHWDDDDLYLPWHLTMLAARLQRRNLGLWASDFGLWTSDLGLSCVKPRAAWWAVGPADSWELRGPCHNVFEGQMLFRRRRALDLGGYPPKVSGQAKALLGAFARAGELETWNPRRPDISYIYRWSDGLHHISGSGNTTKSHTGFAHKNQDFGDGRALLPGPRAGPKPGGVPRRVL